MKDNPSFFDVYDDITAFPVGLTRIVCCSPIVHAGDARKSPMGCARGRLGTGVYAKKDINFSYVFVSISECTYVGELQGGTGYVNSTVHRN